MVFGEKSLLRSAIILAATLTVVLALSFAKAETASAQGIFGTGENVTLANGTECFIFTSVGKTYWQPEVASLHQVDCDGTPVTLFVETSLNQTSGGNASDGGFDFRFFNGFYVGTLSVPATPGTYSATTRATIDGQTFEVNDSTNVPAGSL